MDADGIERVTIAGLSFGGGVAAWIAARYPERVSAVVLISAAANRAALLPVDRPAGCSRGPAGWQVA